MRFFSKSSKFKIYLTKGSQRRAEAKLFNKWQHEIEEWEKKNKPVEKSSVEVKREIEDKRRDEKIKHKEKELAASRKVIGKGRYLIYSGITKLPVDATNDVSKAYNYLTSMPGGSWIYDVIGKRKL